MGNKQYWNTLADDPFNNMFERTCEKFRAFTCLISTWKCKNIARRRLTFHFWALQEDGTPHKVTLSLAFFQVPPFLAVLRSSELLSCVQGPDMSIPTCSSEKSPRSGTEFLEGRKLNFLASKQHQIALMKHQAAFESAFQSLVSSISRQCMTRTQMAIFVDFRTEIARSQGCHFPFLSIARRRHTIQSDLVFSLFPGSSIFGRIDIKWVTLMRAGARYANFNLFQWEVPAWSTEFLCWHTPSWSSYSICQWFVVNWKSPHHAWEQKVKGHFPTLTFQGKV